MENARVKRIRTSDKVREQGGWREGEREKDRETERKREK